MSTRVHGLSADALLEATDAVAVDGLSVDAMVVPTSAVMVYGMSIDVLILAPEEGPKMRTENQHWNAVKFHLQMTEFGVAITGKNPTVQIRRVSDGLYYDPAQALGSRWVGSAPASPQVLVEDATFGGLYSFSLPSGDIDFSEQIAGYLASFANDPGESPDVTEHLRVITDFTGEDLWRVLAMRAENVRQTNTSFHASGQPTAGTIEIYETAAHATADTNVLGSYSFTATYDASSRLTSYVCTKVS